MTRLTRVHPPVFVVLVAASASAGAPARAADETTEMLSRAVEKRTPTFRDRDLARECLSDWVDEKPDDPAIRRALERIAQGCPPASEQLPALTRLHANYVRARAEVVARVGGEAGGGQGSPGAAPGAEWSSRRWRRRDIAAVTAIGVGVVAAGAGWIMIARRRRRA